jgi:hypothetical protein
MGAQAGSRKTMLEVVLLSTSGWFYVVFFFQIKTVSLISNGTR